MLGQLEYNRQFMRFPKDGFIKPVDLALDRKWEAATLEVTGMLAAALGAPWMGIGAKRLAQAAIRFFRDDPNTQWLLEAERQPDRAHPRARAEVHQRLVASVDRQYANLSTLPRRRRRQ